MSEIVGSTGILIMREDQQHPCHCQCARDLPAHVVMVSSCFPANLYRLGSCLRCPSLGRAAGQLLGPLQPVRRALMVLAAAC
jgi:hypothetical protein